MMTLKDVKAMLDTTGMQVAYDHFEPADDAPKMPFITYSQPASNNFEADGKVYAEIRHLYVTLWAQKADSKEEETLKGVLEAADIPWSRNETYHSTERCYEITYEVEV